MGLIPLLLLAFLFVTIGFVGGVFMTLWWVERDKGRQDLKETGEQPDEAQDVPVPVTENPESSMEFTARADSLMLEPEVIPRAKPPNSEKRSLFSRKRAQKNKPEEIVIEAGKPTNLVAQIDVVHQDLVTRSHLPTREIHLAEDPLQGVIVWVGVEKFAGIDAVPDAEIRALIRQAVRDWELRTGSK